MKPSEAKKLKKGDMIRVNGHVQACVTNKDATGLAFMELDPTNTGQGITGVVNWPAGEDEQDFPAPQPIKHLTS